MTDTESTYSRATRAGPARPKSPKNYVLWLLGRREWSEFELVARLKQRGLSEEEALDTVKFVQGHGLQSDQRFAEVKARSEGRRQGNRKVKMVLAGKGISTELISQQLEALPAEAERVLQAARRFEGLPFDMKLQQKAYRFLASRGFSGDSIKKAIQHLKRGASEVLVDDEDVQPDFDDA